MLVLSLYPGPVATGYLLVGLTVVAAGLAVAWMAGDPPRLLPALLGLLLAAAGLLLFLAATLGNFGA